MTDTMDGQRKVLEMLAAGTIAVDDAERLLRALGASEPETGTQVAPPASAKQLPKYLRVVVQDPGKEGGGGDHVNIRVPLQLVRAGMKLGAVLPPEAMAKVDDALEDKGIKLDLRNLTPDTLDQLIEALGDLTLEVTGDNGETVRVFCE